MFFKILALSAIFLVAEGTIPEGLYYRRAPLRFLLNNQGMRQPTSWNYQIVNGRPIISGYPNSNSYVAFGLNPQTGQIEQTQIITQSRPGRPFINMIQNMLNVAGQFFGQVTGAFGNAVGGALLSANQFGKDVQDLTNPVISVTGISRPGVEKEPIQQPIQPVTEGIVRPTVTPSIGLLSTPSIEPQAKSEFLTPIDEAIISFQTLRTNIEANFQNYFESEEGENALNKINENISSAISELQDLREKALTQPNIVLQNGLNIANTAFDNIENILVDVAGDQGRDFLESSRSELNKAFNDALNLYQEGIASLNTISEISPAK